VLFSSPCAGALSGSSEQISGGFKVLDANGQALAYVYTRETKAEADIAKVLTFHEARRIAAKVAKLPELLGSVPVKR
jgi:hypothetical protein